LDIDVYNSTRVNLSQAKLNLAQTLLALTLVGFLICCLHCCFLGICSSWFGPSFCYVIDFQNALQWTI